MKIIKPSVEIMTPMFGVDIQKHLELCGRVCYKSESSITEDSADAFLRNVISRGHESVIEHFNITVKFTVDRGVSHEIVRHRLASYCVSGDTEIMSYQKVKGHSPRRRTIAEIYRWSQDNRFQAALKALTIRSMDEATGTIVPSKIKNVFYNGEKDVYLLETESGRKIKCTEQHNFYTNNGWMRLRELSVGDFVCANGIPLIENEEWIRHNYLVLNKTRRQVAKEAGCCESTLYKAFQRFGIFKPWSDRPNRHPGYGRKGMFTDEQRKEMSERKKGNRNPMYKQNRDELSISGGYVESLKINKKEICQFCGSKSGLEAHHIDKNPRNNSKDNIKILCSNCHRLWHREAAIGTFFDKIISIKYAGKEDVYDLEIEGSNHNYVANGIVVHNSQESTRYCNYGHGKFGGELTFIRPCFWDDDSESYKLWLIAMQKIENYYIGLLNRGATPQEARSVLPNSLKTELIMTANLREWRHFLKLRISPAAHPQIREVAIPLAHAMAEAMPAVFCDMEA